MHRVLLLSLLVLLSVSLISASLIDWLQLHGGHSVTNVRIGDKVTPLTTPPPPRDAAAPPPVTGSILSTTFQYTPSRQGLFVTKKVANNTEIFTLPASVLFNYSSPFSVKHPLPAAFTEMVLNAVHTGAVLDSQALLALRFLLQYQQQFEFAKNNSIEKEAFYWQSALEDLPSPASVCFFSQEELSELQIPVEAPLFTARANQLDSITESFSAFSEMILSKPEYQNLFPSGFTQKWWRWAYGTVLNLALEIPIHDEDNVLGALLVLAPAISHINHANPPYINARLVWNEGDKATGKEGSLSLVSHKDLNAGDELLITYGSLSAMPLMVVNEHNVTTHNHTSIESHTSPNKKNHSEEETHFTRESFFPQIGLSNTQMLVHYGIALPSNEFERIALDIGLEGEHHDQDILEIKKYIIDVNELDHGALVGLDGNLDEHFVHALRTKHLTDDDITHLSKNEYEFLPEHGYLSLQNELKWQLQLIVSVENLLGVYPTTLNQDLEKLSESIYNAGGRAAHQNHRVHALAYRVALKRILHALVLKSLYNVHELFANISTIWADQIKEHNMETIAEEKEEKQGHILSAEEKAQAQAEWKKETAEWSHQIDEWKLDMDKWESTWTHWVQAAMGPNGILKELPPANLHPHATPEQFEELMDPSIHALQLEHEEEVDTVDEGGEHHEAGDDDHPQGDEHHAELEHDELIDEQFEEEEEHDEL